MNIYILLAAIIFFYGKTVNLNSPVKRKHFFLLSGCLMVLLNGLRNIYLGVDDTYNYYEGFSESQSLSFYEILLFSYKDPFYQIFTKIIGPFVFHNFTCYLILVAAAFFGACLWLFNRYSANVLLSLMLFISLGVFSVSMFLVRQILAIAVLLLAFDSIVEKKLIKFLILVLIATLFHASALVFIVAYPVCYFKINKMVLLGYAISAVAIVSCLKIILMFLGLDMVDARFYQYIHGDDNSTLSITGFLQLFLLMVVCISRRKALLLKYNPRVVDILFHLSLLALVFQSGSVIIAEMFRVSLYFKLFLFVLFPMALSTYSVKRYKKYTNLMYVLLMLYYVLSVWNTDYAFCWEHYTPKY